MVRIRLKRVWIGPIQRHQLRFCGIESGRPYQHHRQGESQESMQLILGQEIIKPRFIVPLHEILEVG